MAIVTRGAWAKRLVNEFDLDDTQRRRNALVSWEAAEGTSAKWNPLATTRDMPNDTIFNSVGVRNYASLQDGLVATKKTLQESGHGYEDIIEALEKNAPAKEILLAVAHSAWGTGWLALQVLPYVKDNYERYAEKPIGQ